MVNEREKKLVDYMYTQAQNLLDFMRRNGYEDYHLATITVLIDKEDDKYNSITADGVMFGTNHKVQRTVRKASDCLHEAYYEELLHGGEK